MILTKTIDTIYACWSIDMYPKAVSSGLLQTSSLKITNDTYNLVYQVNNAFM